MNLEQTDALEEVREQMKEQLNLFYRISNLDEQTLSIEKLLETVLNILSKGWQRRVEMSPVIEFDDRLYKAENYERTPWKLESKTWIRDTLPLIIRIYTAEEYFFSEEEQQLIDSIAQNLSAKINRIMAQKELEENQELLDKAYKLAHIGTWEYDMINDELYWSDVTKEVHGFGEGYKPDVESTIQLFKEGFHRDTFEKAANDAIEKEKPFDVELKIISGKGDERWIRATGEPEYKDGVCVRFYGISQNVTSRRQAEQELELNDRRFKALVQHGMDMIAIIDEEANYKYASPTAEKILGWPVEYFEGRNAFDFIHEEDKERIYRQFTSLPLNETVQLKPFRFRNARGEWRWLEAVITNLTDDPAVKGYVSNSRDVTERQVKQEEIIESLKEKETLLSEIHHRIKNNLSVLTGLLQLQASSEKNEEVINRLFDSVARINTMASIHEQLYQSNNFSSLDLADRVNLLALNIKKSFQTETEVDLNFQSEPVLLPVKQALPCSLIANEVLTNIFKHAFEGRDQGKITIELTKPDNEDAGKVSLTIRDDGVGLPDDFDPAESNSLGLRLIDMLSEQLPAEYSFKGKEEGTVFNLVLQKA